MNKINFLELGATLFVPATHKSLESIINGSKYPELRSVVIDTEDGIDKKNLSIALEKLESLLASYEKKELYVFVRPRDSEVLKEMLFYENVLKLDGFVLPKFGLDNAQEYINLLEPFNFFIMPSIEGKELFNHVKLHQLKDILLDSPLDIKLVRFGLEDIFRQLRMKNGCERNPFDIGVISSILSNFIAIFKSAGFGISGGVYPCFIDNDGFVSHVQRDLLEGLMTKTVIHPNQILLAHEVYKVSQQEFDEAIEIVENESVVFARESEMVELVTRVPYAQEVILRAEIYGIK